MLLLLPPSEGKRGGGNDNWMTESGRFGRGLHEARSQLLTSITDESLPLPVGSRRPVLGTLPAFQRYSGVVWQHLDPGTLDGDTLTRAKNSVAVVSALGGLFAFDDLVPDYKLKVGASLTPYGRLAKFWQPHLTEAISDELQTHLHSGGRFVIDLLALEQAEAVRRPAGWDWFRIELLGPNGQRSGHNGKAAKGRFARALLSTEQPLELLEGWVDTDGWTAHLIH